MRSQRKDQASANVVKKRITDLSSKIKTTIQPVFISRKLNEGAFAPVLSRLPISHDLSTIQKGTACSLSLRLLEDNGIEVKHGGKYTVSIGIVA